MTGPRSLPPLIFSIFLFASFFPTSFAADQENQIQAMQEQLEALAERVQALEKRNAELEQQLRSQQSDMQETEESLLDVREQVDETSASIETIEQATTAFPSDLKPLVSNFGAEFYGYIKLDMSYDDSNVFPGNFALWAESESVAVEDDDQFNVTANQTRFGFRLDGPEIYGGETRGNIELDFYGGGAENKSRARMRQAWAEIFWDELDLAVLAGQTWDVISPLYPTTLNFLIQDAAGNIGYRRPQLRVTKGFQVTPDSRLELASAITRTIGDDLDLTETGSDSGFPTTQHRLAYSFPLLTERPTTLGVSGHYGEEERDVSPTQICHHPTWSIVFDYSIPLLKKLTILGELWHGENLATYYGGVIQGVNLQIPDSIPASGGWASLAIGPFYDARFNVGASIDNPEDAFVVSGGREKNASIFGNVIYALSESLSIGMELSYWDTQYKDLDDGDAIRVQSSVIYKF